MGTRRRQESPPGIGLTPNQIVAHNLIQARLWRNWTQQQAADASAPYLGAHWSKTTWSAAERSVNGDRIRQFDADEIVAFARGFDLPVTWFLLPPPGELDGQRIYLSTPDEPRGAPAALLDIVCGTPDNAAVAGLRVEQALEQMLDHELTPAQHELAALAETRIEALSRRAFGKLERWQTSLRAVANQIEDLQIPSSRSTSEGRSLNHSPRPTSSPSATGHHGDGRVTCSRAARPPERWLAGVTRRAESDEVSPGVPPPGHSVTTLRDHRVGGDGRPLVPEELEP